MSSSELACRQLVNTFSFVFWGQLQDLVTSPAARDRMSYFSPSYIQDFLRLILLVVRDRRNTGMNELDALQYNVIQWLCVRDQTYSQLCRALSAIPLDHRNISDTLEKVAQFHQPQVVTS
jgi:hypothetical protein